MNTKIILPGNPIPKHRPRFTKTGHAYNDQRQLMNDLSLDVRSQCRLSKTYTCPIKLTITFYITIPKSLSKIKQNKLENQYHINHVDIDNFLKFYLDVIVLSGSIIKDDSQIAEMFCKKIWSSDPRTEIDIEPLFNKENENGKT